MTPRLARLLTRLYPRAWRDRYGEEFVAFLTGEPAAFRSSFNILAAALRERWSPAVPSSQGGVAVATESRSFAVFARQSSELVPLLLSVAALAVVLGHVALYGTTHQADEGAAAHTWQILTALQLPLILFFAVKWLPRATKHALLVLLLLALTTAANLAAVFFLT